MSTLITQIARSTLSKRAVITMSTIEMTRVACDSSVIGVISSGTVSTSRGSKITAAGCASSCVTVSTFGIGVMSGALIAGSCKPEVS